LLYQRQPLRGAGRARQSCIEQHIAQGEVEIGRLFIAVLLALGQIERGFELRHLLQAEHEPQQQAVAPGRCRVHGSPRGLVFGQGLGEVVVGLELLAQLVVKISVMRLLLQRAQQQGAVAAALDVELLGQVAVVADQHIKPAVCQR
jgi:anti-sigma factor RsiW